MDSDAISDLFAGLGTVSIRRMFGGKGIYFRASSSPSSSAAS